MSYTQLGYGDSETWGGRTHEHDDNEYQCACCNERMSINSEWEGYCGFTCWYSHNRGVFKKAIAECLSAGCKDFIEVEQRVIKKHDLNLYGLTTMPTYRRWKEVIQNILA